MQDTVVGWALATMAVGGVVFAGAQDWPTYWAGLALIVGPLLGLFIFDNWKR